ncbi:unnamed protein product [Eruca vesicaria subsp. sativa]|uniref:Single-stranded DNA binding protein Ssb-like OB fold domain-containing protein n=1 Tax=Eruca vesicaria subsp. sativa TaxID=29727 RepID=A0ABC8L0B2_ERUVS|nr:unnamed protein product [Eruca vesicaria subsp. sativa]
MAVAENAGIKVDSSAQNLDNNNTTPNGGGSLKSEIKDLSDALSKLNPMAKVDLMKEGKIVTLRNAKIDIYQGSMRLAVDRWGCVKVSEEPPDIIVKENNNLSLIEYELVSVEA